VDRLRKTDGMAAEVRTYFSQNIENYVPHHKFKRISQVPVVVAWTVARDYAATQGMNSPLHRWFAKSQNTPNGFEAEALRAFVKDPTLVEYYRRDTAMEKR